MLDTMKDYLARKRGLYDCELADDPQETDDNIKASKTLAEYSLNFL
jgi:hypothetical protein